MTTQQASQTMSSTSAHDVEPWIQRGVSLGDLLQTNTSYEEAVRPFRNEEAVGSWTVSVPRGMSVEDLTLNKSPHDPMPAGKWFRGTPECSNRRVSFGLVASPAYNEADTSDSDKPVAYLNGSYELRQEGLDFLEDDEIEDLIDLSGGYSEAEVSHGKHHWALDVCIHSLFVSRGYRNQGCASALIETFCATIAAEVERIRYIMDDRPDDMVFLNICLTSEPHGEGGHKTSLKYLFNICSRYGTDPDSDFLPQLPHLANINSINALAENFLLPYEAAELDELLTLLYESTDPSERNEDGNLWVTVSDVIDWE